MGINRNNQLLFLGTKLKDDFYNPQRRIPANLRPQGCGHKACRDKGTPLGNFWHHIQVVNLSYPFPGDCGYPATHRETDGGVSLNYLYRAGGTVPLHLGS